MTSANEITRPLAEGKGWGSRRTRLWVIALFGLALAIAVAVLPPLPQPPVFRVLADERALFGIANFLNVVSNLALLVVGVWGLYFLAPGRHLPNADSFAATREKWPFAFCFLGVSLSAPGSIYYHLAPDDMRLFWDRLPLAMCFMSVLSAVIVDRISVQAGLRSLLPFLLAGVGSVIYWRWSVLQGTEDLLPYAAVQYGSIAAIVAIALLFPSRYTRGNDIFGVAAIYAAAKVTEIFDAQIYALGQVVSGHTLKHVIGAVAIWWLLRMLQLRRQRTGFPGVPH